AGAQSDIDAMRGELVDLAIVDDQSLAGKKADAVEPRAGAIDVEAAKRDLVRRPGVHDDSIRAGNKHTRGYTFTGDRDRLRDRHAAEAAGIETVISPPAAVFEIAPGKVLHGAVRLHGLASSPTPETQVRVCACAGAA